MSSLTESETTNDLEDLFEPLPDDLTPIEPDILYKIAQERLKKRSKMSFDDLVEEYELGLSPMKPAQRETSSVAVVIHQKPQRSISIIYAPFIRQLQATRGGVPFYLRCGIFTYEFIRVVASLEEGKELKDEMMNFFSYESIVETIKSGRKITYALYSRKTTEPGRYTGTPLHPKLLELY